MQFLKSNVPQHFHYQLNHSGKTPEEIFYENHEKLVEEGGNWLNKTSESCSVVAALIATVAFAAPTTIPGELNQTSGTPELEKHLGLTIFAYSSLFALFFSITSLFSFLSILTAQYQQKDFSFKLPLSLMFALTMLFVSIVSMLVSFCAGHSFMLGKRLKHDTFTVYALLTCIPIIGFAIQQLPLYFDYLWAIWSKVPRSRNKKISL
ncbi:uncharacterized protein LOC142612520 [Castanea sativa]|uniref:uncharacterized protein LOC142612520 n=1 Tax=Castanea sativa TaxID=21020 RepID=UPI003F653116